MNDPRSNIEQTKSTLELILAQAQETNQLLDGLLEEVRAWREDYADLKQIELMERYAARHWWQRVARSWLRASRVIELDRRGQR